MSFSPIPIVTAGAKHVHADGLMVTASDSSVGMFIEFADIDAMKVAADVEREFQRRQGKPARTLEVVR